MQKNLASLNPYGGGDGPEAQTAAFAAALDFKPLTPAQLAETKRRATEAIRDKGRIWWNPAV